jgi:hypothetical protein
VVAAKFDISNDHAGKFRFHLKAPNGGQAQAAGLWAAAGLAQWASP